MLKAAQKYNVNFAAIRLSLHLKNQLPAWFHLSSEPRTLNNNTTRCLIHKHEMKTIADLLRVSARLRMPERENTHQQTNYCRCHDCCEDQNKLCWTSYECAKEALTRINRIASKLNPLTKDDHHRNLSLTPTRKYQNEQAKENNCNILFDPSLTCKKNLAKCFQVFTDPKRISKNPAQ